MYGYGQNFLEEFIDSNGALENWKIEQLLALENGRRISVEIVEEGTIGVDTEHDLRLLSFA